MRLEGLVVFVGVQCHKLSALEDLNQLLSTFWCLCGASFLDIHDNLFEGDRYDGRV
jgi:hypothetical protein